MRNEETISSSRQTYQPVSCYHCGEACADKSLQDGEKYFCCSGCINVYRLLNKAGLCDYYTWNTAAGKNLSTSIRANKFAFLDDPEVQSSLIQFKNGSEVHTSFYIPYIHCSSCVYLLENLYRLHPGVMRCDIQFLKKEVSIIFDDSKTSLRAVVETLANIGYEPHISLQHFNKKSIRTDRSLLYRLGVAGFCFGNIMLLSIPEYFSEQVQIDAVSGNIFRYISAVLSLPVFFYSASIFFKSAWNGLRHRHLNVDFPVAIAILATFTRSIIDVLMNNGSGYFDSLSGIVFFMLAGRVLQDKTYSSLSFERDYTDYFPMAATVLQDDKEVATPLPSIQVGDTLRIHNNEIVPADGILLRGKAEIDYAFVTGESVSVPCKTGELIYAGGKQLGGAIEIMTVKAVAQSYLTSLWNKHRGKQDEKNAVEQNSFVHALAANFTIVVLFIALGAGLYWYFNDPSRIWPSVTAILIIACPCALLLTATFTKGYLLRILGRNGLYLRNAHIIEPFGKINHIIFDKTGTLTSAATITAVYHGKPLLTEEADWIYALTVPTVHAFSKPVRELLNRKALYPVHDFKEHPGLGVEGRINNHHIVIGTASFTGITSRPEGIKGSLLYVMIDGENKGCFELCQAARTGIREMLQRIQNKIHCSMLSGDHPYQEAYFRHLFGDEARLLFQQQPEDKLNYIVRRQAKGEVVAMVGDGLNDAGALTQSHVGICVAEDSNTFTPAGDAILEGSNVPVLDKLIRLCAQSKNIIRFCFAFSFLYNLTGLYFAVQGLLSPLMAAILMPCSTLTIILITYLFSNLLAKQSGLR